MWDGSRAAVGMAANPRGAHQADRHQGGRRGSSGQSRCPASLPSVAWVVGWRYLIGKNSSAIRTATTTATMTLPAIRNVRRENAFSSASFASMCAVKSAPSALVKGERCALGTSVTTASIRLPVDARLAPSAGQSGTSARRTPSPPPGARTARACVGCHGGSAMPHVA